MMDTVMRTVMSTRIVSTTVTMSSVNEDEHCPYTFAQSAPRNCLQIMLTSSGCVAHSAAAVLWPEYAGFPVPGHHRPQAAQFTMTNISRIKLSQLSSLPIVATLWLVLQTINRRSRREKLGCRRKYHKRPTCLSLMPFPSVTQFHVGLRIVSS